MRLATISKLCCPFDKAEIELTIVTKDPYDNVLEGLLHCGQCKRIYPIIKGIPIMNPDQYREFNLELPVIQRWEKYLNGATVSNFRIQKAETPFVFPNSD